MFRAKLLTIIVGMLATLAVTAVPALAEFQSNSSSTSGKAKTGPLVIEGGGATLECTSSEGEWKIQTAGKIKEHEKEGKQVASTKGPQQYITFNKFSGCLAKTTEMKNLKPRVGTCVLHLEQEAGSFSAEGAIASVCEIETKVLFFTCKISTPEANETTGENINLKENTLSKGGSNLEVIAADEGITSEPKGTCPGVSKTKTAKEKATLLEEGVKAV
jgi:hypothetical protein